MFAAFKTTLRIPDPENDGEQMLAFYPSNYYHCLILEKMDGDLWTLSQRMASLDEDSKKRYLLFFAREMMEAVRVVHDAGFFHNDVKPANFLYRWNGSEYVVKIGDLGIACRRENVRQTMGRIAERLDISFGKRTVLHSRVRDLMSEEGVLSCVLAGTPGYMSLEKKAAQFYTAGGARAVVLDNYDQMFLENDICGVRMSVFYMAKNMGLSLDKHPEIKKIAMSIDKQSLTMARLEADIPNAMIGDIASREIVARSASMAESVTEGEEEGSETVAITKS
jgi:serine/threonine protein kinase